MPERRAVLRAGAEQRARRRAELGGRAVAGRAVVRRCGRAAGTGASVRRPCRGHRDGDRAVSRAPGHRPGERPRLRPRRAGARAGRPRAGGQLCRARQPAHGGRAASDDGPPDRDRDRAAQLWAERFDCAPGQWFAVQDQVVRRIVGTLVGRIEDAQLEAIRGRRPGRLGRLRPLAAGMERLAAPGSRLDRRGPAVLPAGADQGLTVRARLCRPRHGPSERVGVLCLEPLVLPASGGTRLAPKAPSSSTIATIGRTASSAWHSSMAATTRRPAGS